MKKLVGLLSVVVLAIGGYLAFANTQNIADWWFLRDYQPSPEISQLVTEAGMADQGKKLFYVSDPSLDTKQDFNVNCPFEEQTIVLGCYDGRNIFILDINDPELDGVETVTAAHEMLHAAYSRLSDDERQNVDTMLNKQFEQTSNQRIIDLIAEYDSSDQALINNELHSILPTELENLTPELEEYYSQYFDDRQKVVAAALRYEAVFLGLEQDLENLQSQIDGYKSQITAYEQQLETMSEEIGDLREQLDSLRDQNEIAEFNSLVPGFNSKVDLYNDTIALLRGVIEQHNQLVKEINEATIKHNNLVEAIDSNYQEL